MVAILRLFLVGIRHRQGAAGRTQQSLLGEGIFIGEFISLGAPGACAEPGFRTVGHMHGAKAVGAVDVKVKGEGMHTLFDGEVCLVGDKGHLNGRAPVLQRSKHGGSAVLRRVHCQGTVQGGGNGQMIGELAAVKGQALRGNRAKAKPLGQRGQALFTSLEGYAEATQQIAPFE